MIQLGEGVEKTERTSLLIEVRQMLSKDLSKIFCPYGPEVESRQFNPIVLKVLNQTSGRRRCHRPAKNLHVLESGVGSG